MNAKPSDRKERTFLFAVRILKLAALLPENTEARIVRKQIARSGSSIGSDAEEADGS
jgi:four helix bundle protein